jgi:thiosulfate/3-mercaptopyruvate sulfurtransferase
MPLTRQIRLLVHLLVLGLVGLSAPCLSAAPPQGAPAAHPELLVSAGWLAAHLHDANLVILCIAQNPEFYSAGHIPGARLIPLSEIVEEQGTALHGVPSPEKLAAVFQKAGVNYNSRVILYGERLGLHAARAFFTLDYLGRASNAALLNGGIEAWKREGRSLSTEVPDPSQGNFTPHTRHEVLIGLNEMRTLSRRASAGNSAGPILLDARPPEEFSGQRVSQDVPRAGHIPGAACLYWMNLLESAANPVLKPEAELRRIFETVGAARNASAGARVVTYCRTGMQSSMDYFVAKYLGYEAAMYPASFYEWGRSDAPVQAEK